MKKIISMFLLLSLVFQISIPTVYAEGLPPGGHTYDIGEGDIEITQGTDAGTLKVTYASGENIPGITQDNIPKDTILTLTGTSTGTSELERIKKVAIKGGVVANITFSKLAIKSVCTVDISEKSQVNLTLVGKNELINSRNNSGEGLGAGLCVSEGSTLTIMAKSVGELTAAGSVGGAGIGGGYKEVGGTVTINGGAITATGGGGSNYGGAGIGGGSSGAGGIVTITGGSVQATGGQHGAGIGGGSDGAGGAVTISGGTVTATAGGNGGAGIGGGVKGVGGRVTISGGIVTATGGNYGAGIGGGNNGSGGEVTISGGVVTAIGKGMSSQNGAGIGGGSEGAGGVVTISGGTVTATGGQTGDVSRHAAGIGQGNQAAAGTFAATGNAFVMASNIGDKTYQGQSVNTQGIIFEDKNGVTYGNPSIVWDAQIPADHTLTVGKDQSITLNQDATLTNGGTLINNGSLIINRDLLEGVEGGNLSGEGTFISLGDIDIGLPSKQYTGSVMTPTITINQPTILGKVFNSNIATTYSASHEKKSADGNWISGAEIKDAGDYRVLYEKSGKIPFFKAYSIEKANYPGLNIKEITGKKYGDQFTLEMIDGPADVIYSVPEGNGILSIDGNTATATGAGAVTLTASRLGDANHHLATGTTSVTLAKKELLVTANNYLDHPAGTVIPELTYTVSGLVDGDTLTDLELVSTVTDINQAGDYVINISGGTLTNANNYEVTYISGQLLIKGIKYTYEETDNGLTIIDYSGTGEVLIPSTIDGKQVTSIGEKAFEKKNLTNVIIPQGVENIGLMAFAGNQLTSATIPQSVTYMVGDIFMLEGGVALKDFTIYGQAGSEAQKYAHNNKHKFHPSLSLGSTEYYLLIGGIESLTPIILPDIANEKVTWESANPSVAGVSTDGKVTGISKGMTEITVTTESGSCKATCIVIVNEAPTPGESVETITLNKATLVLERGGIETEVKTETLIAIIKPDTAGVKDVTWESANPSVATVDADGKVTAISEGTTVITVTTKDRNYKARCTVTVTSPLYEYKKNDTGITIIRYSGPGGEVEIPKEIDGHSVTGIGEWAFERKYLNSLIIPECVTNIEQRAFYQNDLTHIIILGASTKIEDGTFGGNWKFMYGHPTSTAKDYAESHGSSDIFQGLVSVTTNTPGATAKLTWAAVDAEGLKETVTASTIPTHNFIGWYKVTEGGTGYTEPILSDKHAYTSTFERNRSLMAVYQPLESEETDITIDGGTSYTINTAEQIEPQTKNYPLGTQITVAVTSATDFAYWADEAGKGKILTHDPSYTFAVTGPLTLKAVYNTKIEDKIIVIFKSFYGQIMSRLKLGIEDLSNFMMPKAPTRYGYKFEDWSMTEQQIKDKVTTGPAVIIVTPKYTLLEGAYKISAQNGVLTGGGNDGIYRLNDIVTATASAIELSTGKQFSYWAEANKNPKDLTQPNILSYSDVYKFYATKELDIVAHYVAEGTKVKQKGITQISETKKDSENNKLIFVSMATVPDGCKILKAGIIATNNEEVGTSGNNFNKNAPGVLVRGDAWTGNAYRFTWTKNVSSDEKWYVRSYLLYEDAQKNLFTVYGNMVSQTLRAGQ